ncbi:MAG: NADH-quinone oxidoreductase subunit M [Deferribacterota bacterium]|nr:NADH-quinone oxidoreductase subunit M [Deferribacterota bacterium]
MDYISNHLLTTIVFFPMFSALILLLFFRSERITMWGSFIASLIECVFLIPLMGNFDKLNGYVQFVEKYEWIKSWGVQYYLGVDGISILMVFLTILLTSISILSSFKYISIRRREFYLSMLVLETAMLGVFVALDFFLFYIFWEAMLIPMYLIIGVWGGENKIYAAIKFFIYTLAGSLFMMIAIIAVYLKHIDMFNEATFDMLKLSSVSYPVTFQILIFIAFLFAFAIKVPMFPVHTWLPDAHVEAPTAGSVILAGVLLKMGAYGFLRISLPMAPVATLKFIPLIAILSVVAIIYGAMMSLVQKDMKKLVAYSSVSHMGFVTLGIYTLNKAGIEGGLLQMFNHGIITGALFLLIGIIYERTHTRLIADYGGVASKLPVYATIFMIFTFASVGLPSMGAFVGEFLVFVGAFMSFSNYAIIALLGIVLSAFYMLWLYQRVFFHSFNEKLHNLTDLNIREWIYMVPLIIIVFWVGIYPETFTSYMHESVKLLVSHVNNMTLNVALK